MVKLLLIFALILFKVLPFVQPRPASVPRFLLESEMY